ncbi:hypothetical protein [Streptomyces cylindrosporus]|uniref:Secreted protein n=1 Tax=Streptomyces cylindrosporus TaxID=2927583 RepID=A0ABS9YBK5_9ACTN|nr:hypothetical protein [Streptomyces cylindrosporus]MCI3274597.1 hypothetical protein [Streptomyces cylindrosporus]
MLRGTPGTAWTARKTRTTLTHGRRGAAIGASAAVVCLAAALAACGGGTREGYVATGVVGGPQPSGTAVRPTGSVTLVPLDGDRAASGRAGTATDSPAGSGDTERGTPEAEATAKATAGSGTSADGPKSGRTTTGSPSATTAPSPATPAALTWGDPTRKATDKRWCEDVTLEFANSGGTAVRSGEVTFGTHIIGALGLDWGTVESTAGLPVPIEAGARKEKTWTVCVESWRVPLGMHIETRDVAVRWK